MTSSSNSIGSTDYIKWALKCQTSNNTTGLLQAAAPRLAVGLDILDADPMLLNCPNGTVDLRTGELRSHRANDFLTKRTQVHCDLNAVCPRWRRFLQEIFPDDAQIIDFLQRALGYSLTGDVSEQVFFILYGEGANGKSTFITLISQILGDYAMTAAPGLLMAKKYEAHPTELADLFRQRFVATSEVRTDARWDEERIKQLTGGDKIKARRMREDFWEFMPTHKIWLSANHRPTTTDTTHSFWRRVKMIPFNVIFKKQEQDLELPQVLMEEAPGILGWMVQGCIEWQNNKLGSAAAVEIATAQYRNISDEILNFIEERCTRTPGGQIKAMDLFSAYSRYCEERHERAQSVRVFGDRIRELGFGVKKSGTIYYLGLELIPDVSSNDELIPDDLMG